MRTHRLTLALGLMLGMSLTHAIAASPAQVAKLPTDAPATEAAPKAAAPKPGGKQLAQLTYPVPTTASAADLLSAADDCAFYADWMNYRLYLEQVVSAYPGTKEAGRALALLAEEATSGASLQLAESLSTELAENYPDPEVQAFASLVSSVGASQRAKQYSTAEQAYLAYLAAWPNASTTPWVRLRLADLYRFQIEDHSKAIAVYQSLLKDYPTGPVAEEALVSLAETYNWIEDGSRKEEAMQTFQQALDLARSPGLQVRALYGLADVLMDPMGELTAAADLFTQIITTYPTHPSAALAYALRAQVAEKRGDWEQTVSDMKAFLTYPSSSRFQQARAHWVLAKDAYRRGDLGEAEAEFTLLAQLAETTWHTREFKGEAQAGLAYCAQARGNLRGAMQLFQTAADVEYYPQKKAVYLYQAADLAKQLGDDPVYNTILSRMIAELPGSHLTTKLVGHEVLPAPEI